MKSQESFYQTQGLLHAFKSISNSYGYGLPLFFYYQQIAEYFIVNKIKFELCNELSEIYFIKEYDEDGKVEIIVENNLIFILSNRKKISKKDKDYLKSQLDTNCRNGLIISLHISNNDDNIFLTNIHEINDYAMLGIHSHQSFQVL